MDNWSDQESVIVQALASPADELVSQTCRMLRCPFMFTFW